MRLNRFNSYLVNFQFLFCQYQLQSVGNLRPLFTCFSITPWSHDFYPRTVLCPASFRCPPNDLNINVLIHTVVLLFLGNFATHPICHISTTDLDYKGQVCIWMYIFKATHRRFSPKNMWRFKKPLTRNMSNLNKLYNHNDATVYNFILCMWQSKKKW